MDSRKVDEQELPQMIIALHVIPTIAPIRSHGRMRSAPNLNLSIVSPNSEGIMISEEHESRDRHNPLPEKKRRLHGACDACRKKKVKCDSAKMPDNVCTNCRVASFLCTHTMGRHVKKKDTQASYIRSLEQRLSKMERSLQDIRPENDGQKEGNTPSEGTYTRSPSIEETGLASTSRPKYPTPKISTNDEPLPSAASDDTSEAEDLSHVALTNKFGSLSLRSLEERFYGQSSSFMFLTHTSSVRSQITGLPDKLDAKRFRRPIYWDIRPWEMELANSNVPRYTYPPSDLLADLVTLFFKKVNVIYPILHEPTFRRSLLANQHLYDPSFGMTVLLVCAVGGRYSQDTRVMLPGDISGLSSGWVWFSQVSMHRNSLLYKSDIYDLQLYVLSSIYLIATSIPHAAWTILGLGMRIAQEKGIHRRKGSHHKPTAEGELFKRAFWCLIALDRVKSSFLGRPCLMHDEDFDVEYPIECDDEYWETEDPEQAFKQPAGKPCTITAFICHLKLGEILVFAMRTLYATKKSKNLTGYAGEEWERRILSELDSSMNNWKDTLPSFLQWDPTQRNGFPFLDQSANLHSFYYYLQILIHRPFLTKKSPMSFPSLAMCTTAARACSKVIEAGQFNKCAPYQLIIAAFASGIVIVLNLWGHMKSGIVAQPQGELESLQRCFNLLQECEQRFHIAGRFRDMLETISTFGQQSADENNQTPRAPPLVPNLMHQPQGNPLPNSYSSASHIPINTPSMFTETVAQQAFAEQTNNNPNPDPTPVFPPNNWDFNNLLMLPMPYSKDNLGDNMGVYSQDNMFSMGIVAREETIIEDKETLNNSVVGTDLTAEQMIQLWSGIPASFGMDDWNNYVSNAVPN